MLSAGKPRVSVHEGITTPQYILKKDSLELPRFPLFHRTRRRLCTQNPLAPPVGRSSCFAKSRNIWATARFVKWVVIPFCNVWLKSAYIDTGKYIVAARISRPIASIVNAGGEKGAPTIVVTFNS
jgi:hypothetical protein